MKLFSEAIGEVGSASGIAHDPLYFSDRQIQEIRKVEEFSTVIIRKNMPGFRLQQVEAFADALEAALDEQPKFLVFDFAHQHNLSNEQEDLSGFAELIHASANLIINSSTISIAWARGQMAGSDLEFALSCSMMAAQCPATFIPSPRGTAYTFLARKIGLARAESLMLERKELDAQTMKNLLLIRHLEEAAQPDDTGILNYVQANTRRHNAYVHLYRAQRLVMPVPFEMVRAAQAA
jgi:enoyl-CoA hydratase/carnithine racemase